MAETLLAIQTIATIAILVLFVAVLLVIKRELARLQEKLAIIERDLLPTAIATRELLQNMNSVVNTVGRGANAAAAVIEKAQTMTVAVEKVFSTVQTSIAKTHGRASILKMGLQAGVGSLIGYYMTKRRHQS